MGMHLSFRNQYFGFGVCAANAAVVQEQKALITKPKKTYQLFRCHCFNIFSCVFCCVSASV